MTLHERYCLFFPILSTLFSYFRFIKPFIFLFCKAVFFLLSTRLELPVHFWAAPYPFSSWFGMMLVFIRAFTSSSSSISLLLCVAVVVFCSIHRRLSLCLSRLFVVFFGWLFVVLLLFFCFK